ncbi:LppU/SCO3897 family protein [Antrihabitans spumae]|uniref:LppU/SCO3897 family protein n=1 Tax=Antrihabitans spumae TaxID=3373370 RepID=UPI0037538EF2
MTAATALCLFVFALLTGCQKVDPKPVAEKSSAEQTSTRASSAPPSGKASTPKSSSRTTTSAEAPPSEVGSCIRINKASSTEADTEPRDCSADDATYKIYSSNSTEVACPSDAYTTYTETSGSTTTFFLCLYENLREGNCYEEDALTNVLTYVACSDPAATYRVTTKAEGVEDESVCGPDDVQFLAFPDPQLTYCLAYA